MCYKPIRILNPSRHFKKDAPLYLFVPCGHCEDCRRNMQNEWFFRAYQEYLDVTLKGGSVFFPTLTYNDDYLPEMEIQTDNGETVVLGCFSNEHIRSFMRKLRIYLERSGYDAEGVKYIICSEYGGKKGRNHYHGTIFMPFRLDHTYIDKEGNFHDSRKLKCTPTPESKVALELFRRAWIYGFVGVGKYGIRLTDVRGVRYAMKYITKQQSFYDQKKAYYLNADGSRKYDTFDFKTWLNPEDKALKNRRISQVRELLPFHRQSLGIGLSFVDTLKKKFTTQQELIDYLVKDEHKLCDGEHGTFRIPRYYHKKFEREYNKDVYKYTKKIKEHYTPLGFEVKLTKLINKVKETEDELKSWNQPFIETWLPELATDVFNNIENVPRETINRYYEERRNIIHNLFPLLRSVNLCEFSVYQTYLRYFPIEDETKKSIYDNIENVIKTTILPQGLDCDYYTFFNIPPDERQAMPLKACPYLKDIITCSKHPEFTEFEKLSQLIDQFRKYINIQKQNNQYVKNRKKEVVKKAYLKEGRDYTNYESRKEETNI